MFATAGSARTHAFALHKGGTTRNKQQRFTRQLNEACTSGLTGFPQLSVNSDDSADVTIVRDIRLHHDMCNDWLL
jgi:hypothetical protein